MDNKVRESLVKLAHTLPKGSKERRVILGSLKFSSLNQQLSDMLECVRPFVKNYSLFLKGYVFEEHPVISALFDSVQKGHVVCPPAEVFDDDREGLATEIKSIIEMNFSLKDFVDFFSAECRGVILDLSEFKSALLECFADSGNKVVLSNLLGQRSVLMVDDLGSEFVGDTDIFADIEFGSYMSAHSPSSVHLINVQISGLKCEIHCEANFEVDTDKKSLSEDIRRGVFRDFD